MIRFMAALLFLAFVTPAAQAKLLFECKAVPGFHHGDMYVDAAMKGVAELKGEKYLIEQWSGYFSLNLKNESKNGTTFDNTAWNAGTGANVAFDKNYQPTKYVDYLRFDLNFPYIMAGDSGTYYLLLPRIEIVKRSEKKFEAYLMMSAVGDHFGTTVPLICNE